MTPENSEQSFARNFSRNYLLILLIIASILFFNILKLFFVPVLLAAVFTSLFYPLYDFLLKRFKNRKSLSSLTTCFILLLGLMIPTYFVIHLVSLEGIELFNSAKPRIEKIIAEGENGKLGEIKNSKFVKQFRLDEIDLQATLQDLAKNIGKVLTTVINKTSRGTLQAVADIFITLFTMFYFFRDGHKLIKRIKYLSPLDDVYEEGLIHRFVSVSRATVKGTILIGLVQGTLGGLTLWLTGVDSPILWGVVMVILSVIPLVGAWLVLHPAAIIQLILGNYWQGITILLITLLVIGSIDNLLRPRLVGRDAGMHDLMIFFSTLGGISVFGIMGFIIGPVIAVFFLTILDIYSVEFKSTLDLAQNASLSRGVDDSNIKSE